MSHVHPQILYSSPWKTDFPEHWVVDRIKDVIERIYGGGTPSTSDYEYWDNGDIIWITPTDFQKIKGDFISSSEKKITHKGLISCSARLLPEGTVIMASRATIGITKIAASEVTTNQGFVSFVCKEPIYNKFFFYCISAYLGDYYLAVSSGTTFREISGTKAKQELIGFPEFIEQKHIALYLDSTCAAIDRAIDAKQEQLKTLVQLRKSIIYKAVTKGLDDSIEMRDSDNQIIGEIPKHWKVERIKQIVSTKITDGPHETPTLEEEGIPFISAEAIKEEKINFDKKRGFISVEQHEIYSKKCKPRKYDIFIVKSGATTGNVAYVDTDLEFNIWSPLAVVRCNPSKAYYKYFYYQFLSEVFRKQVELAWSFGTQENIGMGVLGRLFVTVPPPEEQMKIVKYLDSENNKIQNLRKKLFQQITALTDYKKSLIHECITGKRRITEDDLRRVT